MFPRFTAEGFGVPGLIAIIAITHVFVAHFAVGGGLYLVTTERLGHRLNRPGILDHARRHARFFVLLTLVFGALSGVAIWFVVGLASPDGIFELIRVFVWAWAAEWCFFLIELATAIVYYKTWDRLTPRDHMRVGWLYAGASIVTLLIINGILSFMLSPGRWVDTKSVWDGLFNPTYVPTTIMRLGACTFVAGCFALVTARAVSDDDDRTLLWSRSGRWIAVGLIVSLVGLLFTHAALPAGARDVLSRSMAGTKGGVPWLRTLWWLGGSALLIMLFAGIVLALRRPTRLPRGCAVVLVVLGFVGFGSAEAIREMLRKPFVIRDVVYANGIYVDDIERFRRDGFLSHTVDAPVLETGDRFAVGEAMYRHQCAVCHTRDGYRGLRGLLDGWNANRIGIFVDSLAKQKPGVPTIWSTMPPLVGDANEIRALRAWLEARAAK